MADYYDELLGSIAVCLLGGALVGLLTSVAFHLGLLFGALAAMAFLCDALFVHPPLPETDPRRRSAGRPTMRSRSVADPRSRSRYPSSAAANSRGPMDIYYIHMYVTYSTLNGPITDGLRRISSRAHPFRSRSTISRSVRRLSASSPSLIRTS